MKYVFGGGETYWKIIEISSDKKYGSCWYNWNNSYRGYTYTQSLDSIFPNFIFNVFRVMLLSFTVRNRERKKRNSLKHIQA